MGMMFVTAENRILIQAFSLGASQSAVVRWPLTVGSGDVLSLRACDMGRYNNATPSSINIPNAFTVVKAAIEDGTTSVPLLRSGSRTWVVNPGDDMHLAANQTDLITAAQFGRTSFTQGMRLWLKMELSFATTSMQMPYGDRITTHVSGSQVLYYTGATTLVNDVDGIGAFTTTGTAPGSTTAGYCPLFIGYYAEASNGAVPKVIYGNGDSIGRGFGDTSFTSVGSGIFQRMLYGTGAANQILSGCNFCRDGSFSTAFLDNEWIAAPCQYANIFWDEPGTNDFGSSPGTTISGANQLGRVKATATLARSYGIKVIIRTMLGLSTSSASTNWTSDADQTAAVGWSAGANVAQFNAGLAALVGTYIDVVVPMVAWHSLTDYYKFVSNGTNDYGTADGAHPTTVIVIPLAAENRSYVDLVNLNILIPGEEKMAVTWESTGADSVQLDKNRTFQTTGNLTLVAADSGKAYIVKNGTSIFSLPATAPGLVYTFQWQGKDGGGQIQISPVTADGIGAAGTAVVNKDVIMATATIKKGDFVKIISGVGATGVTAWHVTEQRGILTKEA